MQPFASTTPRLAAAALLLAACASAPPFDAHLPPVAVLLERPTSVEATLVDGTLLVPVTIDGRGPFRFAVDTGSTTVIVDRGVAGRARLPVTRRTGALLTEAGRHEGDMPQARIRSMRVGDAEFRGVGALVADLSPLSGPGGRRLDGILGMPVLRSHVWTLDLGGGRVTVAPAATATPRPDDPRNEIPVAFEGGLPHVDAVLSGHRVNALLDTGQWTHFALSPGDSRAVRARLEPLGTTTRHVLGGSVEREAARLDGEARVGPLIVLRPEVVLASSTRTGLGVFEGRTLVLDFARARVTVAP